MSWHRSSDGTITDIHGDAPITAADLRAVDFDALRRYTPTIGGLRHLTDLPARPPERTVIWLLCGDTHEVGSKPRSPHVYDCHACAETVVERERAR